MKKYLHFLPGLLLTIIVAVISFFLSSWLPVGAVVVGISLGMLIGNLVKLPENFFSGIAFAEKQILAWAIILMGVKLDFNILKELGLKAILIIVISIFMTITISQVFSKIFGLPRRLGLLLGIGNGVCGSSAIAATEKVIGATKHEVGISVALVNFLGTLGMFFLPVLAKYILHFNNLQSGFLIGNTLQAVGQVVAAGFSLSHVVGHTATIVKMMRILMLTPLVIMLLWYFHRKHKKSTKVVEKQGIPYFIVGFILLSLLPTFHLLSERIIHVLGQTSHYLLLIAMVAIGLKINFKSVLQQGVKSLLVASSIFIFQIVFTIIMIEWFIA